MTSAGRPPNILVFMTDQQQAAVTERGHPCRMPNVNRFAEEGVRFVRAHTPTALCAPARASLMTGLYAHRHVMLNNPHVPQSIRRDLVEPFPMWSDRLKDAGYRMHYCGKWGVTEGVNGPDNHGWEIPDRETAHKLWTPWPGRDAALKGAHELRRPGYKPYLLYGEVTDGPEAFPELRWTRYAAARLKELAAGPEPWCLFLALHGPHDPYLAPSAHLRLYDPATVPQPVNFDDSLADKPAVYRRQRHELWGSMEWEDYAGATAAYWAYNSFIDDLFGELLAALDATGQARDTLVLYLSDHGEMMGAHGLFFKGVTAFEECYRIPLIARWPAGIEAGKICGEFASLLDVGPTLLEAAGAPSLPEAHGRSFLPLLRGVLPADWPQEFFGQFFGSELLYTQRILVTKTHKYVFNGFDFDELYDLVADPGETRNLYFSPEHEPLLHEMVARMWRRAFLAGDLVTCHGYPTTDLVPLGPYRIEQ